MIGPSTPEPGVGASELDAYAVNLAQLHRPRLISPPRQAPSTILPSRDRPAYDGTGKRMLVVAAYRHRYAEALLVTPCRGAVSCKQAIVQPLLQTPLDTRYARWSPDFQSVIVAGEHDLYVVPVAADVVGAPVQISDRFAGHVNLYVPPGGTTFAAVCVGGS